MADQPQSSILKLVLQETEAQRRERVSLEERKRHSQRTVAGHGAKNMAVVRRFALGAVFAELDHGGPMTCDEDHQPGHSCRVVIVQQVFPEQRLLQRLRQAAETPPVIGHRAAAMRDQEFQRREVLEKVRGQALHESRGVGVQVMRARGVKAGVAAGRNVDHGGDVELHHLLVNRVPVPVRQRRRSPVPARRVGIEIDTNALASTARCRSRPRSTIP
jgi:hypothetical protein